MSSLVPQEWSTIKIASIGDFYGGLTGKTAKDFGHGEFFLTYMQVFSEKTNNKEKANLVKIIQGEKHNKVKFGDILFTTSSETPDEIGMTTVFLEKDWTPYLNSFCFGLRPIVPSPLDPYFAKYLFRGTKFRKDMIPLAQGSTRFNLSKENLKKLNLTLPPLPEQKKIASILTSVDEVIENTQKQIDKLQDLKKATMNELLTKGIGHTEFKDSELGRIPKSWEVLFLHKTKNENDRYSFTGGPFGSNLKNCDFTKNGVRIIQLQNIGDGNFLNEYKIYTSSQKADELISCNIYPGDIILSKMGDPVARATIIPDIETRYVMSSDGIRLSINEKKYDLKFILESINHHSTRNQAKVLSIGSTRQRIGLTDIRKLLIRIPQLDEQKKISSVINSIDLKIKKINQKLVKTKLLKKSLMDELLTGKVRVSVN